MALRKKYDSKDFKLSDFFDYKSVPSQYEDSFIKKVHAVKLY